MAKVVQHIWEAIRFENTIQLELVFDRGRPIRSTGDMGTWYTGKPCEHTTKSHINCCVFDSTWEATEAFELDHNSAVTRWVKNDHLGFEILYIDRGVVRKYRPDFIVRLIGGSYLVLETKGRDSEKDQTKRRFLDEWVRAVNAHGGFGTWSWEVSHDPSALALATRYSFCSGHSASATAPHSAACQVSHNDSMSFNGLQPFRYRELLATALTRLPWLVVGSLVLVFYPLVGCSDPDA